MTMVIDPKYCKNIHFIDPKSNILSLRYMTNPKFRELVSMSREAGE